MPRFVFCAFILVSCLVSLPASAATDFCDLETTLAAYNTAIKRQKLGDVEAAHKMFLNLADQAIAPAQRHVAKYYLEESRDDKALENAIMWAQLAAWGGDKEAQRMILQLIDVSRYEVEQTGRDWARYWKPRQPDCIVPAREDQGDHDFKTIGRFPVVRHEDVDEDDFEEFVARLSDAIGMVDQVSPYFSSFVQLIPAFEVIEGEGTDRFIHWDKATGILQISNGYLNDKSVKQLSYGLLLAVQREMFATIKDAQFVDQIATSYGKLKLYGSIYGDVKTKRFISLFTDAMKRSNKLPVIFRDKVNSLDEIHYMPPSRYHRSRLAQRNKFAHYAYKKSNAERRIAVVNHKMGFEDAGQILIELVRLGTQAQQHAIIESFRSQNGGQKREDAILKALEGEMDALQSLFTQKANKQKELIETWDEKGPDGVKRFACDAIYQSVKAAIALKLAPNRVTRMVKFERCKKAQDAWRNRKAKKT